MMGYEAYKTFLGMQQHFAGRTDGWKYNFTGNIKVETFMKKTNIIYQFANIEKLFPNKHAQICFFYPAFAKSSYVPDVSIKMIHNAYKQFMSDTVDPLTTTFKADIKKLAVAIDRPKELFNNSELFPTIYNLVNDGVITYSTLHCLIMLLPKIGELTGQDPFVFPAWIKLNGVKSKFLRMYLTDNDVDRLGYIFLNEFKLV